jgi:hypothetical protein
VLARSDSSDFRCRTGHSTSISPTTFRCLAADHGRDLLGALSGRRSRAKAWRATRRPVRPPQLPTLWRCRIRVPPIDVA